MGKRRADRGMAHPGETQHAEGQHGPKTHRAFIDQLQSGPSPDVRTYKDRMTRSEPGRHRMSENREQHDEPDKNAEANRKRIAVQRGQLDPNLPGVADKLNGDAGHG